MKRINLLLLFASLSLSVAGQKIQSIYSESLKEERLIQVRLPRGYESGTEDYGVLYVLDGEYVFEYAAGTVDFLSNPFGFMPPLLVVGLPNVDRLRDMHVTFGEEDSYQHFIKFIENELKPFIDKKYRTNGFDILYGWSSAANINFQFLAKRHELFDAHIQAGTGVGSKTSTLLSESVSNNDYKNQYLYVGTEGAGPRAAGLEQYKLLMEKLTPSGLNWKMELLKETSHVDVLGEAVYNGLKFIYNDFYIPDSVVVQGVEAFKNYYSIIDQRFDFNIRIPEGAFGESAGILFQQDPQSAIELIEYGLIIHPSSSDLHGSLGEVYEYMGETKKATKYYRLAFENSTPGSMGALKYQYLSEKFDQKK